MDKNIQPQYVVLPLVLLGLLILAGVMFLLWRHRNTTMVARYEKAEAQYREDSLVWESKAKTARKEFEAEQDRLTPKGGYKDYWNPYEYEQRNPRPVSPNKDRTHPYDMWQFITAVAVGLVAVILFLPINLVTFIPYNAKYYTFDHVQGVVTQINGATQPDGKYVVTNWVFKLEGDKTLYTTDDERIQAYRAGDTVDLTCTVGWNPNGLDSHSCQLRAVSSDSK